MDILRDLRNDNSRITQADKIVFELYETENIYVNGINRLIDEISKPIQQSIQDKENGSIISASDHRILFKSIENIIVVNRELLINMEKKIKNWSDEDTIGDLFSQFAPYFKPYSLFAEECEEINKLSKRLDEHNKLYRDLLINFKNNSPSKLDIYDVLITPIQRIPRYILLLEALLKHCSPNHKDVQYIPEAISKLTEVANSINQSINNRNERNKVQLINNRFLWNFNLVDPARKYISEGFIHRISLDNYDLSLRVLILFNDLIVIAIPVIGTTLTVDETIPLKTACVIDKDGVYTNSFYILSPDQTYYIKCQDKKEKLLWMDSINRAIVDMVNLNPYFIDERETYKIAIKKIGNVPYLIKKNEELNDLKDNNNLQEKRKRTSIRILSHISLEGIMNMFVQKPTVYNNVTSSDIVRHKSSDEDIDDFNIESFELIDNDDTMNPNKRVLNAGSIIILPKRMRECTFNEILNEDFRHEEWPADSTYIVFPESTTSIFKKDIGYIVIENFGKYSVTLVSHKRKSDIDFETVYILPPQTIKKFNYTGLWCIEVRSGDCKYLRVLSHGTSGGLDEKDELNMV